MYEAVLLNIFLKRFEKLPKDIKERIAKVTDELMENPYLGLKLRSQLAGFWKIIFFDIDLRKKLMIKETRSIY
ncbi:MAG: hypothetical protein QW231_02510 [Candidatus Bathyarchaeia archaeon]